MICGENLDFWGFVVIRGARDTPRTINNPIGILMFAAWGHQGAAKTWKCAHFHNFHDFLLFYRKMQYFSNSHVVSPKGCDFQFSGLPRSRKPTLNTKIPIEY